MANPPNQNNNPNNNLPQNHPFSPYGYPDAMNAPGKDALSQGFLQQEARTNYYDVTHRTTNAVPTDPGFDSDVYDFENIRQILQRNAPLLWVVNLGSDNIYVRISHNGSFESSHEATIVPGEVKVYYNVWNLAIRSPTKGNQYQVSEYSLDVECCPTSSGGGTVNLSQQTITAIVTGICNCISTGGIPPIEKATITNQAVLANTDVFGADIAPTNPPSFMIIEASFNNDGSALLNMIIKNGANSITTGMAGGDINSGAAGTNVFADTSTNPSIIQHGHLLLFTGDTFNIQFTENVTLNILRIVEVKTMVGR